MSGQGHGGAGYGVFGSYTKWAVVFLILFILFLLLSGGHGY